MKHTKLLLTVLALASGASALTAAPAAPVSPTADCPVEIFLDKQFGALEDTVPGKFNINSRTRYEIFDLDNGNSASDRDGFSERVRYGYTTETFYGFNAMVEGETVTRLGGDHDDIHPLDDAGDGTDWNQLWLGYKNADYGKAKLGRQIYTLDDQRFIGHVGWRQNIQTFDAFTGAFTGVKNLSVNAFYMDGVNRVNADHTDLDTFGFNTSYKFADALKLTGFYYNIKSDDIKAFSNDTYGLRATGSYKIDEVQLKYAFSYAHQEDNSDTPTNIDADYFAGDLAATYAKVTLGAGFEIFEDDFRTPLATVHKFNGFADVFLPITGLDDGLEDYYVYAGYKIPVGKSRVIPVKVVYHSFDPKSGSKDYGDEIDLVASFGLNKYVTLVAKYGDYRADDEFAGVGGMDKKMFTFDVNFVY